MGRKVLVDAIVIDMVNSYGYHNGYTSYYGNSK